VQGEQGILPYRQNGNLTIGGNTLISLHNKDFKAENGLIKPEKVVFSEKEPQKQVKKHTYPTPTKEVKKTFLLNHIIAEIENGKYPSQIAKELKVSKQKINYFVGIMKKQGLIKRIGYGVWEVNQEVKRSKKTAIGHYNQQVKKQVKKIRGHALIWKVNHNIKSWNDFDFKERLHTGTPRKIINGKKVWFGKKHIVIYSDASYFGFNAIESKKYAVSDLLDTLKEIEAKQGINLKPYTFVASREHYAIVKNELARQYNRNGEKLHVKDNGEEWLLIDDSYKQGGELETIGKKALTNNIKVNDFWNDNKLHNFQVTPTFVLNQFKKMQTAVLKTQEQVNEVGAGLNTLIRSQIGIGQPITIPNKNKEDVGTYIR